MNILGISAFYHDSAAVLVRDGRIVAAAQEERFSRKKHDQSFPHQALRYCLAEGKVEADELEAVAFYDKPITKFSRLLETYFSVAPRGWSSFLKAMPIWIKQKLWTPLQIEKALEEAGMNVPESIFFPEHHESHAASAFFPSPYNSAAILTLDGVGEWSTAAISKGRGSNIEMLYDMRFPHSLGLLYSAFTYFTGFRVNSGEYKLMGLAPYGEPEYVNTIYEHLIDLKDDGSFRMNLEYFDYLGGLRMTNDKFAKLFGGPPREPESEITQREMDLARSIQEVTEEICLRMARHAHKLTGEKNLCLAGGVALNCVSNGRILRESPFENVWIQPAADDAGGALGAALAVWHMEYKKPRHDTDGSDSMQGAYLGPSFSNTEISAWLETSKYPFERIDDPEVWADKIAQLIEKEKVVGLFQGRMEFGPRGLGCRSILGDARSEKMQSLMNMKIKYRESFRPFAPSCLEESIGEYFEIDRPSPYMLFVADVKKERCVAIDDSKTMSLHERINQTRSDIPAVTHLDNSARIQTVNRKTNPRFYDIIKAFEQNTGCGVIINTSFNVRGEPIVCRPADAYRCFMRTEMDALVLENFILYKEKQPEWTETADWRNDYVLD